MQPQDAGTPVKIVAGGGIEGCVLVAQPGLDQPAKLKGKTLGTFQLDMLVGRYYKTSMENARIAMGKQPSVDLAEVDARSQTRFIMFCAIWEALWAAGLADPRLLLPPHVFLGNIAGQAKFFNTISRWQVGAGMDAGPAPPSGGC